MNSHILIQSKKEDIFYCEKCGRLSYKGKICQNLPFKCINTFNIDPLKIKYHPITAIADYNIPSHIKYLECKNKGISKIKKLFHFPNKRHKNNSNKINKIRNIPNNTNFPPNIKF